MKRQRQSPSNLPPRRRPRRSRRRPLTSTAPARPSTSSSSTAPRSHRRRRPRSAHTHSSRKRSPKPKPRSRQQRKRPPFRVTGPTDSTKNLLPRYDPLCDPHLSSYFRNPNVRRTLRSACFVDPNGRILPLSSNSQSVRIIEQEFQRLEKQKQLVEKARIEEIEIAQKKAQHARAMEEKRWRVLVRRKQNQTSRLRRAAEREKILPTLVRVQPQKGKRFRRKKAKRRQRRRRHRNGNRSDANADDSAMPADPIQVSVRKNGSALSLSPQETHDDRFAYVEDSPTDLENPGLLHDD